MNRFGPMPDLDSLRCFVEGARYLNFRAAARAVGLSPAAFGQRIRSLEEQLEVDLFVRTTRKVELSEAGLSMVEPAQQALEAAQACTSAARGTRGPAPQDILVGTRHELGLSWLLPAFPVVNKELPHLTLHLYFGSGADLENRIRTQEIDCAISSKRIGDPSIEGIRLHEERYVLVGAPALLQDRPLISPDDASNHILVDINRDLPLMHYYRDAAGAVLLPFEQVRTMGTIAAIRAVVLEGKGVAVLPEYLIQPDLKAGRLRPLLPKTELLSDHFRLLHRRDDPRISLLRELAAILRAQPLR